VTEQLRDRVEQSIRDACFAIAAEVEAAAAKEEAE
jgi:hypothetical protein